MTTVPSTATKPTALLQRPKIPPVNGQYKLRCFTSFYEALTA